MNRNAVFCLLLLLAHPLVLADDFADENARLRAEVEALKARNEALQHACSSVPPAASATSAPAASPVSTGIPASVPAAGGVAPAPAAPQRPAYANAGCDRSLFQGPPPGKWQDPRAWRTLHPGMSMTEVEVAVGVEHFDVTKGTDAVQWQYGRCTSDWAGSVTFKNGMLATFEPPDR